MATYLAYGCGKGNQNFVMTTENYEAVIEANLIKRGIFKASDFEFINLKTNTKTAHKVGHTVTKKLGTGVYNSIVGAVTDSYFKLDGVNIFNVLATKGYRIRLTDTNLVHPEVSLLNSSGEAVAVYKLNVKAPRQDNVSGIGKSQLNTVIETESDDLEYVFLGAFMISRVKLSTKMM